MPGQNFINGPPNPRGKEEYTLDGDTNQTPERLFDHEIHWIEMVGGEP